jgi:SHS2 domain-containing protein
MCRHSPISSSSGSAAGVGVGSWCEIDHTADVALRIWGDDLADLFAAAARGMFDLAMSPDAEGMRLEREIALDAPDAEGLLVDWLNELLYLAEIEGVVFVAFDVSVCRVTQLRARLVGLPVAETRRSVKAAT